MAVAAQDNDDDGKGEHKTKSLSERIEKRIERVPQEARTPDRDEAAREILRWQAEGEWPLTGPEMSERGEYSPQHYRNCIALYSLKDDNQIKESGDARSKKMTQASGLEIEIPDDVELESYARGWLAGFLKNQSED